MTIYSVVLVIVTLTCLTPSLWVVFLWVVLVIVTLTCLTPSLWVVLLCGGPGDRDPDLPHAESVGGLSVGGPGDRDPDLPLAESVGGSSVWWSR